MKALIDELYYQSAKYMPLWWSWQWKYVMKARFYFERRDEESSQ